MMIRKLHGEGKMSAYLHQLFGIEGLGLFERHKVDILWEKRLIGERPLQIAFHLPSQNSAKEK